MSNRLAGETSPYLLQHAHNPVDWYPWGPEALDRAKAEDKPILLSVGYSACHWCHVMERESFEDADVAAQMNQQFVCVKVDREERPDLDEIYMRAVQAFTGGHGGWPMTVFLTPAGKPYFGGTYFPPRPTGGMPSFRQVLDHAARLYRDRRPEVDRATGSLTEYLRDSGRLPQPAGALTDRWLSRVVEACAHDFDPDEGGFGGAPKFPPHGALAALLAAWKRTGDGHALHMATTTLDGMAKGGMWDLIGGGFARYSVDTSWRIPHFEKMLYDNAQLVPVYLDAYRATGNGRYARVAREALDWILREMHDEAGGFHSATDADSEGEEGRFFAWTPQQVRDVVGVLDGVRACTLLQVTEAGTFEHGTSVLRLETPMEDLPEDDQQFVRRVLPRLFAAREGRVRPGKDDKIVTSWNALAISAFAKAGAILDVPAYRGAATRAARFLLEQATVNGRLMRTWKQGRARIPAFADDHAALVNALIDVWEATFDLVWLREANRLADTLVDLFWDDEDGGVFYTGRDAEALLARSKHMLGGAEPSANGLAALAFARLDALSERTDLGEKADRILLSYQALLDRAPRALGVEAVAGAWRTGPVQQVGVVGGAAERLIEQVRDRYLPFSVLAWLPEGEATRLLPFMEGKHAHQGHPTAFVCEDKACRAPTLDPAELGRQLDHAPRGEEGGGAARLHAPALPTDPGAWLNTERPLPLESLRGNVVVLDFWTYCCINCMHVLPELAALEEAFEADPVVVIGVHSAKFAAEKERANVETALHRHRVRHPVVLDPTHRVWEAYTVNAWPSVVVLDANGRIAWRRSGEVTCQELHAVVQRLLAEAEAEGSLGKKAWTLPEPAVAEHGLHFPGKVAVWPDVAGQARGRDPFGEDARLYVADTGNHRVLELALSKGPDGWPRARRLRAFGGNGAGLVDGTGEAARFSAPQGVARSGNVVWVADTGNHALRTIDLAADEVRTVAGTGRVGRTAEFDPAQPRKASLRSPWDVAVAEGADGSADAVFVAMAGTHQVWVYLPAADQLGPFAGSGREDHVDGALPEAAMAQPSGLSLLGRWLFVADSEVSSVRAVDLAENKVGTLCGRGLFDFGDVDGRGEEVRMQHPLGIAAAVETVYVADTFNGKVKAIDLQSLEVRTLAGGDGTLSEPGGLTVAGDFVLVADTNHHRLRAVHRITGESRDLLVEG